MAVKLQLFWHRYEFTDNLSFYFVREYVPILRASLPGFWLAGPLGLAGITWALAARRAAPLLVAASVLLQMMGVVAFHFAERYRLAAVPALLALGSAALVTAARGERAPRLAVAGGLALGILVTNLTANAAGPFGQNLGSHHEMLGAAAMDEGRFIDAAAELRRAIALDPGLGDAWGRLASALAAAGNRSEAETAAARGAELHPGDALRFAILGDLRAARGDLAPARDAWRHSLALRPDPEIAEKLARVEADLARPR